MGGGAVVEHLQLLRLGSGSLSSESSFSSQFECVTCFNIYERRICLQPASSMKFFFFSPKEMRFVYVCICLGKNVALKVSNGKMSLHIYLRRLWTGSGASRGRGGWGGGVTDVWLIYHGNYVKQLCTGMFKEIIRFIPSQLTAMFAETRSSK